MYYDGSDEVIVCLELFYLLHGIVIIDSDMKIIGSAHNPLFLYDESDCSDGVGRRLDSPYASLREVKHTLVE